jgi:hypothetical protein
VRLLSPVPVLLLMFVISPSSFGAWSFDGTNDYVETGETSGLYLPDGDWTIYANVQVPNNAGTANKFIFNTLASDFPTSGFIDWYIVQDSHATTATRGDLWIDYGDDGNGVSGDIGSSGTPPFTGNAAYTVVLIQRSGNTVTQYVGTTANGSFTNGDFSGITPTGVYIGARFDLESTRFFSGNMAGFAIWSRALTAAEMTSLANGWSPNCYANGRTFYMPMIVDYQELQTGIAVTNHGSTSSAHPRLYMCN